MIKNIMMMAGGLIVHLFFVVSLIDYFKDYDGLRGLLILIGMFGVISFLPGYLLIRAGYKRSLKQQPAFIKTGINEIGQKIGSGIKKVFGVILIISAVIFISVFIIVAIDYIRTEGSTNMTNAYMNIWMPGMLMLLIGIILIKRSKPAASAIFAMNANLFNEMNNDEIMDLTSVEFNFETEMNEILGTQKEAPAATKEKVTSVQCSGCGAKVTASNIISSKCEYCGTVVQL